MTITSHRRDGLAKGHLVGTHRAIAPAKTVAHLEPHLSRFGITRVANVTGLDRIGVPVVMVCRPNARSLAVSQGKGLTLDAAKASGIMEAIELAHAETIDQPLRLASAAELTRRVRIADTRRLARASANAYHDRLQMLWIEGHDLVSGNSAWAPFEMVHMNYALPGPVTSGSFHMSSNGLASGNHRLEALTHGICELIERDAMSLWAASSNAAKRQTRLRLDSIDDDCRWLLERIEASGLTVGVWDVTSDVAVPCFHCLIFDERDRDQHPGSGQGCHPSPEVALARALSEACQVRATYISGVRDDVYQEEYEREGIAVKTNEARELVGLGPPVRCFDETSGFAEDDFERDVTGLIQRLTQVGIEQIIVVALGGEELGISVTRSVIPGLESPHDMPGYCPGERARRVQEDRR